MKFRHFLVAALALSAMVACETGGDDTGEVDGSYTIDVVKDTIEADGKDSAVFIVRDSEGNNVMEDSSIASKIYFVNAANGSRLPRETKAFTSIKNGVYTYYATVKGVKTTNTVDIKVQNRAAYEKYMQKVLVYQFTGSWCVYCPQMTEGLDKLRRGEWGENVIVMACHISDEWSLEVGGRDFAQYLLGDKFGQSGIPYAVYDLSFGNGQRAESILNSLISDQLLKYPATCGVKIASSSIDADGNVAIETEITATAAGRYDVGYAVLADHQTAPQGRESEYNDIVVAISPNYAGLSSTAVSLKPDEVHKQNFNTKVTGYGSKNLKVVVFVHSNTYGPSIVDNAATCAMGDSVNYILN